MAIVGQLEIQLLADVARLKSDMAQAKAAVQESANVMTHSLEFLKRAFEVGVVIEWAHAVIEAGDSLVLTAQKVGMSVEQFSALQAVMHQAGIDAQQSKMLVVGMSKSIEDNAGAWKELGISVTDSRGTIKPTNDLLLEAADIFQKLPDGIQKTRLATALFHRQGADLIPVLNKGSEGIREMMAEAQRFGAVASGTAAAAAHEFGDRLSLLKDRAIASSLAITEFLWPALIKTLDAIDRLSEASRASGISSLAEDIGKFARATGKEVITVVEWLNKLAASVDAMFKIGKGGSKVAPEVWENLKSQFAAISAEADKGRKSLDDLGDSHARAAQAAAAETAASRSNADAQADELARRVDNAIHAKELEEARNKAAAAAEREAERVARLDQAGMNLIAHLEAELALQTLHAASMTKATEAETQYEQILEKVRAGHVALSPELQAYVLDVLRETDALKQSVEWRTKARDEQVKAAQTLVIETKKIEEEADAQRAANLTTATGIDYTSKLQVAKLEEAAATAERIAFLDAEFGTGQEVYEGYLKQAEALRDLANQKRQSSELVQIKKDLGDATQFSKEAARNIQDTMGQTVEATLSGHFDNILSLWVNMLNRMVAQAIAAQLAQALFGKDLTSGVIGQLLQLMMGGGSPTIGPGAGGSRQELQSLSPDAAPAREAAQGTSTTHITLSPTVNVHIDAAADRAQTQRMVERGVAAGNQQLVEALHAQGRI